MGGPQCDQEKSRWSCHKQFPDTTARIRTTCRIQARIGENPSPCGTAREWPPQRRRRLSGSRGGTCHHSPARSSRGMASLGCPACRAGLSRCPSSARLSAMTLRPHDRACPNARPSSACHPRATIARTRWRITRAPRTTSSTVGPQPTSTAGPRRPRTGG